MSRWRTFPLSIWLILGLAHCGGGGGHSPTKNPFATHDTGGADAGGGNGSPAQLIRLARFGIRMLLERADFTIQKGQVTNVIGDRSVDLVLMQKTLSELRDITPTDKQLPPINGKPVCLINHPKEKTLEMNIPCFDSYNEDTKLQMALHELWGLTFHDGADDSYRYSSEMARLVREWESSDQRAAVLRAKEEPKGTQHCGISVREIHYNPTSPNAEVGAQDFSADKNLGWQTKICNNGCELVAWNGNLGESIAYIYCRSK